MLQTDKFIATILVTAPHRLCNPLRGAEGCWRIHATTATVLPEQPFGNA